jgi:hypothetical protein
MASAPAPVRIRIDAGEGLSLIFRESGGGPRDYPSCRIQKGLVLCCGDRELVEEGTGFGVPVLRFGHETVFPGEVRAAVESRTNGDSTVIRVDYELNLVERMVAGGEIISGKMFYAAKEYLAGLHRRYPPLRGIGTWASNGLRTACHLDTRFETAASRGVVRVLYAIQGMGGGDGTVVHMVADLTGIQREGCTGIIIANEQGANYFDRYRDSKQALVGRAIGTWDETRAGLASFIDSRDNIAFVLRRIEAARMFRGRERVENRLAWAGLSYVIPVNTTSFAYDIQIGTPNDLRSARLPVF